MRPRGLGWLWAWLWAVIGGPAWGGEPGGPGIQGYTVPGRNPDSQAPYEFFLGNAAHRLIAYMYGVNHPGNIVYYNTEPLYKILDKTGVGDPSLLLPNEHQLRPDITDASTLHVFEIKPSNERGLQEGRLEVNVYLTALNRTMAPGTRFSAGRELQGEILIRFARGQYIWRLEWRTPEPGVTQYRWTRSQQRFESEAAAYAAEQWTDLTEQELRQYGGWVGQAVDDMLDRRARLTTVQGAVGIVIEVIGTTATAFFSGVILERIGASQKPPAQGGTSPIPFPAPKPAAPSPTRLPAAARSVLAP